MRVDQKWHKDQVAKYAAELPIYEVYARTLKSVLHRACEVCEAIGIIQARAKAVPSFAEKAIRKAHKYNDPVHQLTDLCGARAIVETHAEVERICSFIRANFRIDEANSLDILSRMKAEEFGYRAVHYVVQVNPGSLLGVKIDKRIGERKAEIQVCTLLQYAWTAISHDRVYKSDFEVPKALRREVARVAAILEDADEEFARAVKGIDAYKLNYAAYMSRDQMREETEILEMVLEHDKGNLKLAHKIAQLAMAREDWDKAISVLTPFLKKKSSFVLRDFGIAKCRTGRDGRPELEKAAELDPSDADAFCALGDALMGRDDKYALECFEKAFKAAPSHPRALSSYLECKVGLVQNIDFIPLMRPALEAAIEICRSYADTGVYLPWAFYDAGIFALMLNRPFESLAAYARAVSLSDTVSPIKKALRSIEKFEKPVLKSLPEMPDFASLNWAVEAVRRFLLLAIAIKSNPSGADKQTTSHSSKLENAALRARLDQLSDVISEDLRAVKGKRIVMVVGGCDVNVQDEMEGYRAEIEMAFEDFEGVIFCGGTEAGLSGIIGDLKTRAKARARLIAYRPHYTPAGATIHKGYDILETQGIARGRANPHTTDFTVLEPIQSWIDLTAAGVEPSDVRILGINGGPISAFEYRMALALGATVGIVESSGRSALELHVDEAWWGPPNLIWLPRDRMALRAFVNCVRGRMASAAIKRVAQAIHGKFLQDNRYKNLDPAMVPWPELRPDFKDSNIQQAAYARDILIKAGYAVREVERKPRCLLFRKDEERQVEFMAEMEHGRWIDERLRAGWSYGPERDPGNKRSPYLVAWKDLPENIKEYDRDAVCNFPSVLAEAGLEVFRPPKRRTAGKTRRRAP